MGFSVAYGRVSSQQQAKLGALARQEQNLIDGAGADRVILDVGSGTSTARKGYQELLDLIATGDVDRVLVADQDRFNRSLKADLALLELCRQHNTRIFDLQGRELEFRTPDGELLVSVVGALNQHRSRLYGQKVTRNLQAARDSGLPVSPKAPFGLRKVRDPDTGKVKTYEVDPDTQQQALQRINWFLEGKSLTQCIELIGKHHQAGSTTRSLARWLKHPCLTGRLAWKPDKHGDHAQVQEQPSFEGLITDAQHELIKSKLSTQPLQKAIRNRQRRMFSGIFKCGCCGNVLSYKVTSAKKGGRAPYLRCGTVRCKNFAKHVSVDRLFGVLQYAMHRQAQLLVPLLDRPAVDPPEIGQLQSEIRMLQAITGTEALIEAKQAEINRIRSQDTDQPSWVIVAALQSPNFWLADDEKINATLHFILNGAVVDLGETVADSYVREIRFKTTPALAELPDDQDNILLPVTRLQLNATINHWDRVQAALDAIAA